MFWSHIATAVVIFGAVQLIRLKQTARNTGRKLARNFGKGSDSDAAFDAKFDQMWELTWRARDYESDHEDEMKQEVEANLAGLNLAIMQLLAPANTQPTGMRNIRTVDNGRAHLRRYRVVPASEKVVIFSDIHLTNSQNRQNFFERANKSLYLDILKQYYSPRQFTLIENGDVEELLIFEPDDTMPDYQKATWRQIIADRERRKLAQMRQIVDDHADYYTVLNEHFINRGAFYRTIGNHDYDLASNAYVREIRTQLDIRFPLASDIVFIVGPEGRSYVVCHGHQFDAFCSAKHAAYTGESFSQGGAWAFQGPDRTWTTEHDDADFLRPWLAGTKTFSNMLVTAEPAEKSQVGAAIGQQIGNLKDPDKWEALLGKNVAWEYFKDKNPQRAYKNEVEKGERWYKFRHMDEQKIVDWLTGNFGDNTVKLVLGHSHEPRINAGRPASAGSPASVATNYLNSAAAGRFENLIWGIEIVDGEATMISWHRELNDAGFYEIVRSVWSDHGRPNARFLRVQSAERHASEEPSKNAHPEFPHASINKILLP